MTPALQATSVTAGYRGRAVVTDVTLAMAGGESLGIVGPNAVGKSTLLRVLVGDLLPISGDVRLDGQPLEGIPPRERARRIALVPQSARYDLDFSVREMVALGRAPHSRGWGLETSADRAVIDQALLDMELNELRGRAFSEISGGERQRVLFARALVQQAPILLLDEPTAHLDLGHQLLVMERLEAHTKRGGAALIVLHDLTLAMRLDRVLILDGGRVVADGRPDVVLSAERLAKTWGVDGSIEQVSGGASLVIRGRHGARTAT